MTKVSMELLAPRLTALRQAELLQDLVQRLLAGQLWTLEQRKDARLLVGLLNEHSRVKRRQQSIMNHLERKLSDDANDDREPSHSAVEARQA